MTFNDLKPGDKVFFYSPWVRIPRICPVEKVHKLHIVVQGMRFKKRSGYQAGVAYSRSHIDLITPETTAERDEALKQRKHNIFVSKLYKVNWREQSDEVVTEVAELLKLEVEP